MLPERRSRQLVITSSLRDQRDNANAAITATAFARKSPCVLRRFGNGAAVSLLQRTAFALNAVMRTLRLRKLLHLLEKAVRSPSLSERRSRQLVATNSLRNQRDDMNVMAAANDFSV
ncbi:MAG: hypothetical protein Q4E18_08470 [Clostridia bacterium]|nr:hypothetical protein [Clostridia bacterium]